MRQASKGLTRMESGKPRKPLAGTKPYLFLITAFRKAITKSDRKKGK